MATTHPTDHTSERLDAVIADVDRNRRLVEDSRRKRAVFESRLRRNRNTLNSRRTRRTGLFGWLSR